MPPLPLRKRQVAISETAVTKVQEPEASRRERLRTLAAQAVAEETGLFVVPAIVSFDDARGEIVFQRLHLVGLRQALSEARGDPELIERVGRALAAIHRRMDPIEGAVTAAGPDGARSGRAVALHGDFGMRNVFYIPGPDRIAIIDWTNADWIDFDADCGPPEVDLAVFLVSLFHRRVLGPWPVSGRHEMARRFLAAYASAAPHGVDVDALCAVVGRLRPAFTRMVRRRKGGLRALGSRHAMVDLAIFLRRLRRQTSQPSRRQYTG